MSDLRLNRGLVQIYTGNGKGKTTAAMGLALRAVGFGLRVHIMQFMKGQTYSELISLRRLAPELTSEQVGRDCFLRKGAVDPVDVRMAEEAFVRARVLVASGIYDLVILDELNCAVDFDLIPVAAVLELIRHKAPQTELVLTGRNARPEVIEVADLVTEMREIKHYFNAGQPARAGIES
ncbi:MAG: cob(I)yrinic acid a,c-diamide adenosyltransferase [Desulfuromonadales bacterium GWD2_61_12]|nr:MAG: cob(I)yrinic acid a,c-diamide adenosyltransferase [Desulfuromonadales bacterium GWD2_61_12]HBT82315.1 cob(I)yrinic acid a,c-diamide adenosyltransferase [Desulfuromonas sp.]